jgi:DNA-directed RNA polymerase subunit RPC12/RpoP
MRKEQKMTELQKMTDLERALLHIKTRADAWALKEVEKALSQEPTDKPTTAVSKKGCHNCKWADEIFCNLPNRHMKPCKNFSKWEQEPCDDAISREAVCNIVNDIRDCISVEGYWAILERLKKLPPVTQKSETVTEFADRCRECGARYGKLLKQKSGKWIYQEGYVPYKWKCNQCSAEFKTDFNFCPNCGAKMESEDKE